MTPGHSCQLLEARGGVSLPYHLYSCPDLVKHVSRIDHILRISYKKFQSWIISQRMARKSHEKLTRQATCNASLGVSSGANKNNQPPDLRTSQPWWCRHLESRFCLTSPGSGAVIRSLLSRCRLVQGSQTASVIAMLQMLSRTAAERGATSDNKNCPRHNHLLPHLESWFCLNAPGPGTLIRCLLFRCQLAEAAKVPSWFKNQGFWHLEWLSFPLTVSAKFHDAVFIDKQDTRHTH
jgi:hypothetical protein